MGKISEDDLNQLMNEIIDKAQTLETDLAMVCALCESPQAGQQIQTVSAFLSDPKEAALLVAALLLQAGKENLALHPDEDPVMAEGSIYVDFAHVFAEAAGPQAAASLGFVLVNLGTKGVGPGGTPLQ